MKRADTSQHVRAGTVFKHSSTSGSAAMVGLVLLLVLSVLPNLNALQNGYVFDDRLLAPEHPAVAEPFDLGTTLTSPHWVGIEKALLWRPITTFSFAADARIR